MPEGSATASMQSAAAVIPQAEAVTAGTRAGMRALPSTTIA